MLKSKILNSYVTANIHSKNHKKLLIAHQVQSQLSEGGRCALDSSYALFLVCSMYDSRYICVGCRCICALAVYRTHRMYRNMRGNCLRSCDQRAECVTFCSTQLTLIRAETTNTSINLQFLFELIFLFNWTPNSLTMWSVPNFPKTYQLLSQNVVKSHQSNSTIYSRSIGAPSYGRWRLNEHPTHMYGTHTNHFRPELGGDCANWSDFVFLLLRSWS